MLTRCSIAILIVVTACTSNKVNPDASSNIDAKVFMDAKAPDAAALPVCTGQLYDACNPLASNCVSGMCHTFTGSNFSVCTQTCTGTCPNQGAAAVACNTMGICKPNAPNATCMAP